MGTGQADATNKVVVKTSSRNLCSENLRRFSSSGWGHSSSRRRLVQGLLFRVGDAEHLFAFGPYLLAGDAREHGGQRSYPAEIKGTRGLDDSDTAIARHPTYPDISAPRRCRR